MDALTFGSKVLLRHLTFSEARKMPIKEFHLEQVEYWGYLSYLHLVVLLDFCTIMSILPFQVR